MKKILWFILLIILNPKFILANEIIYSNYTDYTEFDENHIDSSELIDVKKEERYLWYKEEFVEGDYELYNGGNNYILDDCYDSEYSSWMTNKEEKKGRIYEERVVYDYELSKPLRYIHLTNLYGSYGAFRIPELIIKINGVSIDYDYICEGCLEDFDKYIKNGIYNENKSYIKNGGSLIIDLKKEYPIQNVELIFYIFDLGEDDKKYTISYSLDKENIYASKDYVYEFSDEYWINSKLINHYIYDLGLKDLWTINIVRYTPLENEYVLNEKTHKEYRYKERYCKTYTINKKYSETYTKEPYQDFNIKDESKSKTFYASKTREKIELKDNLSLNSYQYDLNDFVVYSSNNYEITSDININKNGIYNINFKTNRINVDRKVSVNILDNDIKMYQGEIDKLHKKIIELNGKVLNLETVHKTQLSDKDAIINSLSNELNMCKENCEEKINCINKEINEKNKLIEEYKKENESLIQQIKSLNEEVKVLKESEKSDKNIINELNADIKELENSLNETVKELNLLIIENRTLDQNINNLEEENKNYLDKIQELEKINNQYKDKVNQLLNDLDKLNIDLNTISKDNLLKKQEIQKLNELVFEYEQDISNLNNEIDYYNKLINELKENSELELGNISNILMDANTKNEIYLEKINLLENNIMNLNSIINSLKLENHDNITKYENEVLSLKMLNEEYLKKIKELEIQLHNLNSSISYTINSKDEVISSCEEELKTIKKDAFDEYGKLNAKINEETKEKEYLNNKLNNYMLKIDGENKINLVYIVILVLSLLYLFLRKKSSEK